MARCFKRREPHEGKINLGPVSTLRKLMRAAKRGKIPAERMIIVATAEAGGKKRATR